MWILIIPLLMTLAMSIAALVNSNKARSELNEIRSYLAQMSRQESQRSERITRVPRPTRAPRSDSAPGQDRIGLPPTPVAPAPPTQPPSTVPMMDPPPIMLPSEEQQHPQQPTQRPPEELPYSQQSIQPPYHPIPQRKMTESIVGRNILAIVAAALALIGLVFLGVLVVPHLTDSAKIIMMFLISAGVGALGYALHRRKPNVLTQALIGTGIGGLFVSIEVTHLHFHALNDIVTFALIVAVTAGGLWLSHHTDSVLVAVLIHAYVVIEVLWEHSLQRSETGTVLFMVYQVVVAGVIIVGDALWCRRTYRLGLFAAQLIILASSWATASCLSEVNDARAFEAIWYGLLVGLLVQAVMATVIAHRIFASSARSERQDVVGLLASMNAVMWSVSLVGSVFHALDGNVMSLVSELAFNFSGGAERRFLSDMAPTVASVAIGLIPTILVAFLPARDKIAAALKHGTAIPLAVLTLFFGFLVRECQVIHQVPGPRLMWMIVLAAAYLTVSRVTLSRVLAGLALAAITIDALVMFSADGGYYSLTESWTIWASLAYLAVSVCIAFFAWRLVMGDKRLLHGRGLPVGIFIGADASLAIILAGSDLDFDWAMAIFAVVTSAALAVAAWKATGRQIGWRLSELAFALLILMIAHASGVSAGPRLLIVLSALVGIALFVNRIRDTAMTLAGTPVSHDTTLSELPEERSMLVQGRREVISAFGLTFAAHAAVAGLPEFDWGYPLSLTWMVVALAIIVLGLWGRIKALRLYGLIQVIVSVLKLTILDIGSVDSVTRVVAFLGGAAICFGISALYNAAAKRFDRDLTTS